MSEKWTQELRRIVFSRLAMEFGKQYWKTRSNELPFPKTMTETEVLNQIAHYLTWLTKEKFTVKEVDAQLAWARSEQKSVNKVQSKQFVLCKAAAYEVGLISNQPSRETIIGA